MQEKSDAELLSAFASGDDAAFRELVTRYADLVYSAALRQVESSAAAGDIAQSVFIDLARKARTLAGSSSAPPSLAGWLHRATRYTALNYLRDTRRRLTNESQAMEQLLANSESAPDWEQIRPVLDEALDSLNDEDREALLLRYFKNHDFRAVGLMLGVSDDAAQKRVTRAVERLREFFSERKVTIGASGLVVLISANALQAAPLGLATAISAAAVVTTTAVATSTSAIAITKTIAMTTLQKTLATAAAAILVGTGIYQAKQAAHARAEIQSLQQQQASLTGQISQMQSERDAATNQLAGLLAENFQRKSMSKENETDLLKLRSQMAQLQRTPPPAADADPFTQSVLALAARAAQLNQYLQQMPDKKIPELRLLDESDWLNVSKNANFDTDAGIRKALQKLRSLAKAKVPIGSALYAYANANNGQLPTNLSQLKPYFDKSNLGDLGLDDSSFNSIIGRYTLLHTGSVNDFPSNTWFVVETAPVDKDYDSREKFGLGTSSVFTTGLNEVGDPDDSSY